MSKINTVYQSVMSEVRAYSREKAIAHEEKKLTISLPRNDFKHTAHIGINGESFGQTGFLTPEELEAKQLPPSDKKILQKALTMNKSNSNNSLKSVKKVKSPILEHSVTIVRPDRPLISRRRHDTESDDEEILQDFETSDMLSSVLAVMETEPSNDKVTPYQKVIVEESSSESSSEDEQNDEKLFLEEPNISDTYDAIQVGPNNTGSLGSNPTSEPQYVKKNQSSLESSYSIRSSVSDNHEVRQQKLNAIVNRFNSNTLGRNNKQQQQSESEDENDEPFSLDEDNDEGEAFSLEDEEEGSFNDTSETVKLRNESLADNEQNRRSVVEQIKSNDMHILGHKNSLASSEREIML